MHAPPPRGVGSPRGHRLKIETLDDENTSGATEESEDAGSLLKTLVNNLNNLQF